MRVDTRFAGITLALAFVLISGCGGGGTTPPVAHAPTVEIIQHPPAAISPSDHAAFVWQGADQDGDLAGYFIKLDGAFQATGETTITYTNLSPGSAYTFEVFAVDSTGLHSDTASWSFQVSALSPELTLAIFGQGVTDADADGFWTQFNVKWSPQVSTGSALDVRLLVGIKPTYGSGSEILDSTALVTRNPGDDDTLTYTLPPMTKNYYDIRAELHGANGSVLLAIPYDSITSLTEIGLEDLDGFHAWFDDAWTANAVDTIPPIGYCESIEIWWDVDAYPDDGRVKVVVYERNSLNVESNFFESQLYEVSGFGGDDAFGLQITAGTTLGIYDYRLKLLDQFNNLLDEITYGEDPDLMDIPLGQTGGLIATNNAHSVR